MQHTCMPITFVPFGLLNHIQIYDYASIFPFHCDFHKKRKVFRLNCSYIEINTCTLSTWGPGQNRSSVLHVFACRKRRNRCGTIKTPPCSKAVYTLKREHKSKFCSPLRVTEIFKERYTCITCTSNTFLYYLTVIEYMYLGFFFICVVILNREKYDKPNYFHSMYRHVYAIALY